ncbi:MAG: hypothetical protein ABIH52_01720 [Candidatus Aenigmatarchaeota archaeon]
MPAGNRLEPEAFSIAQAGRKEQTMFVQVRGMKIEFDGTKTTDEEREILRRHGFVHVTGLQAFDHGSENQYVIGENLQEKELGRWDKNNGVVVLNTLGGEVWVSRIIDRPFDELNEVFDRLAPNGKGAFVPLSNGEHLNQYDIFLRVADSSNGILVRQN